MLWLASNKSKLLFYKTKKPIQNINVQNRKKDIKFSWNVDYYGQGDRSMKSLISTDYPMCACSS